MPGIERVDVLDDRGVGVASVDWFDIDADAERELGLDERCVNWSAASVVPLGEVLCDISRPNTGRSICRAACRDLVRAHDLEADAPATSLRQESSDHTVLDRVRVGQRLGSQTHGQVGHHSALRPQVEQLLRCIANHLIVHVNSLPIGDGQARTAADHSAGRPATET